MKPTIDCWKSIRIWCTLDVRVLPFVPPISRFSNDPNCAIVCIRSNTSWHLSTKLSSRPKRMLNWTRHGFPAHSSCDRALYAKYASFSATHCPMVNVNRRTTSLGSVHNPSFLMYSCACPITSSHTPCTSAASLAGVLKKREHRQMVRITCITGLYCRYSCVKSSTCRNRFFKKWYCAMGCSTFLMQESDGDNKTREGWMKIMDGDWRRVGMGPRYQILSHDARAPKHMFMRE